jgi:hypothetical protein
MAAKAILYDTYALDRNELDEDGEEFFWGLPILHQYVEFIHENQEYISAVINLDTIGDAFLSEVAYKLLKAIGVNPIPVYGNGDDISVLDNYVAAGATFIALGGSKDERSAEKRSAWANEAAGRYPDIQFHFLGTLNPHIIRSLRENIVQVDGTCWNAIRKERRYGGNSKVQQSIQNIREKEKLATSPTPPFFVASSKVSADAAALICEQGTSLMRTSCRTLSWGDWSPSTFPRPSW